MAEFSNHELTDMHFCYGLANGNGREAKRLYEEKFPNRVSPHHSKFQKIHQHLSEHGKFYKRDSSRPARERTIRTAETEENVLHQIENNPSTSTRAIAQRTRISNATVWRILKEQQLYPFHLQKVQNLLPADFPRRLDFCTWMRDKFRENDQFFRKILFTDEACFTRDGLFNSHNMHIWDEENPHQTFNRSYQHRFSLNVWCGILGDNLIGPYFFEGRLTGEIYAEFLTHRLSNLLDDVSLVERRNMWFMHDGAPPHTCHLARNVLNNEYPNKWIGNNGPILWPARSPELNMMDFYFWGHLKTLVYNDAPIENLQELRQKIINGCNHIRNNNNEIFPFVRQNLLKRCELCIRFDGQHFEQFL